MHRLERTVNAVSDEMLNSEWVQWGEWSCLNPEERLLPNRILPWFEVQPGGQFLLGFQHSLPHGCWHETGCGCSLQSPRWRRSGYGNASTGSCWLLALQERTNVGLRQGGSSWSHNYSHSGMCHWVSTERAVPFGRKLTLHRQN